jgi:hypothetical protein
MVRGRNEGGFLSPERDSLRTLRVGRFCPQGLARCNRYRISATHLTIACFPTGRRRNPRPKPRSLKPRGFPQFGRILRTPRCLERSDQWPARWWSSPQCSRMPRMARPERPLRFPMIVRPWSAFAQRSGEHGGAMTWVRGSCPARERSNGFLPGPGACRFGRTTSSAGDGPPSRAPRIRPSPRSGGSASRAVKPPLTRKRYPVPEDALPPLDRVLMTHVGCVMFTTVPGELVEPTTADRFYPDVVAGPAQLIWAVWRRPGHAELVHAWPARTPRSPSDLARGWWQPTIEELRPERRKAASLERARETRKSKAPAPNGHDC